MSPDNTLWEHRFQKFAKDSQKCLYSSLFRICFRLKRREPVGPINSPGEGRSKKIFSTKGAAQPPLPL